MLSRRQFGVFVSAILLAGVGYFGYVVYRIRTIDEAALGRALGGAVQAIMTKLDSLARKGVAVTLVGEVPGGSRPARWMAVTSPGSDSIIGFGLRLDDPRPEDVGRWWRGRCFSVQMVDTVRIKTDTLDALVPTIDTMTRGKVALLRDSTIIDSLLVCRSTR